MNITGIIAEYNPFHSGHAYHIQKAREISGADYIVAVMSPDFVQRGEPAVFDKYTRTRAALLGGADLVLELPVLYACASAEYFALGAAALLDGLGAVDSLCFGSETPSLSLFLQSAKILEEEPEAYRRPGPAPLPAISRTAFFPPPTIFWEWNTAGRSGGCPLP